MVLIFIIKHFNAFLIFNLRISQKVEVLKWKISRQIYRQIFTSASVLPLRLKQTMEYFCRNASADSVLFVFKMFSHF